ncbi:hypothetical protein HPB51_023448 [Rhipicephalus microplus]|uniref:Tick transposon n=1 Tax=Rhipicephalus microplus TaxID=6941 RepID=A0A9J6F7T0_RHIMP|nr:hypothetical protein HPB51_023448 [Rhipicephalus microplus]
MTVVFLQFPGIIAEEQLRFFHRSAADTTEYSWQCILLRLSKLQTKRPMPDNLRVLGNGFLPEKVALVLKNGPRFSVVPTVSAYELLALNRGVSRSADEENRERCLLQCADSLLRNRRNDHPELTTGGVVSYFKEHELSLLQTDKEDGFVVMSTSSFQDKASSAIMKNFESTTVKASKVKSRAVELCKSFNLANLAKSVLECKKTSLEAFFNVKTHKIDMPFRSIVTENGP